MSSFAFCLTPISILVWMDMSSWQEEVAFLHSLCYSLLVPSCIISSISRFSTFHHPHFFFSNNNLLYNCVKEGNKRINCLLTSSLHHLNTISEGPAALSAFFSSISEVLMQAHSHWANLDLDQILDKKNSQAQSAFCSFLGRKIEFFITNFWPYFPCTLLLSYDFIDSIIPPICLLAALSATFFQAQISSADASKLTWFQSRLFQYYPLEDFDTSLQPEVQVFRDNWVSIQSFSLGDYWRFNWFCIQNSITYKQFMLRNAFFTTKN